MPQGNQADFAILGETADFLAVDKPAGLLVHPTKPGGPRTLWDGLRELLGYEIANGGQVSIVNRLDRETSGVVLIAKSSDAASMAGKAMQRGGIEKSYEALAFGWPDWDEIEVDAPILRQGEVIASEIWLKRAVHPDGAPSTTRLRILGRFDHPSLGRFSHIHASPLTGRTHQIRVHLAHVGFPVLGDKIYARGGQCYLDFIQYGWTPELAETLWLPRHALHCRGMRFDGIGWASPLPEDLKSFIEGSLPAPPR